jgi:hypothetical protein
LSNDFFTDPSDELEVEPPELGALVIKILTSALTKRIVLDDKRPWTAANENKIQEEISELVAKAKELGLATIKVIAVRKNGQRTVRELSVEKISRERKLQ